MTEVELPDGTIAEFPDSMSPAEIEGALQKQFGIGSVRPQARPAPERSFMDALYDNVIGADDGVESYGEQLGSYIRGAGAATARGIADVPAVPANLLQLGNAAYEKVTGQETKFGDALDRLPDTRDMLASVPVIGPESQYRAPGKAGEFISTAGEFAGGAGVMAGPGAMVKYGALPGLASEAAGQATEGTKAEPYARAAAALATPALLARTGRTAQVPGRDPQRLKSINTLEDAGVKPTAGQATGSDILRRVEGTAEPLGRQIDNFTAGAMRKIGSTAKTAHPEHLKAARDAIVKRMDDAVAGVNVRVPQSVAPRIDSIMKGYNRHITSGNRSNVFNEMADEIKGFAANPNKPVPLSTLKTWRSDIGKMTTSADDATRDAAHGFRKLIDDLTDQSLRDAGKARNILDLSAARNDYRNYLAIEDAATRKGSAGGKISPPQLNQAVIRTQGRKNYATGQGTDMMGYARAGEDILAPMPTVTPGGERAIQGMSSILGGGLGFQLGGVPGAFAGAAAPLVAQGLSRSPLIQNAIKNPGLAAKPTAAMLPGLLSD